jgi:hypothetical protein
VDSSFENWGIKVKSDKRLNPNSNGKVSNDNEIASSAKLRVNEQWKNGSTSVDDNLAKAISESLEMANIVSLSAASNDFQIIRQIDENFHTIEPLASNLKNDELYPSLVSSKSALEKNSNNDKDKARKSKKSNGISGAHGWALGTSGIANVTTSNSKRSSKLTVIKTKKTKNQIDKELESSSSKAIESLSLIGKLHNELKIRNEPIPIARNENSSNNLFGLITQKDSNLPPPPPPGLQIGSLLSAPLNNRNNNNNNSKQQLEVEKIGNYHGWASIGGSEKTQTNEEVVVLEKSNSDFPSLISVSAKSKHKYF